MNSLLVEGDLTTVVPTNICEVVEIDSKKYEVYSSTPWRDADSIIGYYSELIAKL
jgi:phage-related protein